MMHRRTITWLGLMTVMLSLTAGLHAADSPTAEQLAGIWAMQAVNINGEAQGGNKGSYLVLRDDGTFRIIKRGQKPTGKWRLEEGELVLSGDEGEIMRGEVELADDELTLTVVEGGDTVELIYKRTELEEEPPAPDAPDA
ncbi:MAG: hypothetical protein GVY24_00295 [Planctomycetes bacterium]|nr:hypothetical protein [Planctomycetota bacterium]